MPEEFPLGATTVGLVVKDGVILASEKRVTYGYALLSKSGKKVFKITDKLGIACAGLIADMQAISRVLAAEVKLYEIENGRIMPIKSAAKLLSVILFNNRSMPYFAETLVGGVDNEGPHLFVLDPLGSVIEDKYAALGSGARIAIGIIESEYKDGLSLKEGEDLAIKAVKTAIGRDAISGDGIDLLMITDSQCLERFIPLQITF
mgnify:FL=1